MKIWIVTSPFCNEVAFDSGEKALAFGKEIIGKTFKKLEENLEGNEEFSPKKEREKYCKELDRSYRKSQAAFKVDGYVYVRRIDLY